MTSLTLEIASLMVLNAIYQHIFDLAYNNLPFSLNITLDPINQFYLPHYPHHSMLHSTQLQLFRDSNFPSFTIKQKNWSDTTLVTLPRCFEDKHCFQPLVSTSYSYNHSSRSSTIRLGGDGVGSGRAII